MTILLGLIGRTLGHSFSARYFADKFERECIDGRYALFEMPKIENLQNLLVWMPGLRGFNVTIPYKEEIIPFLSEISDDAREIGAVNTVLVKDGKLIGYNTDWRGFRDSILTLLPKDNQIGKALVLGSGGAAKAVVYALRSIGIRPTVVSRNPEAVDWAESVGYDSLDADAMEAHRLVVNATPLGTWPNTETCPPVPYGLLTPEHICADLVYNPSTTEFMRRSAEQGATTANGYRMLVNQAELSWQIWERP